MTSIERHIRITMYLLAGVAVTDFWDTAGQERFSSMHPSYYYRAHACILVFDVTRKATYKNLSEWYGELRQYCEGIPCLLVANKIDVDYNVSDLREEGGGVRAGKSGCSIRLLHSLHIGVLRMIYLCRLSQETVRFIFHAHLWSASLIHKTQQKVLPFQAFAVIDEPTGSFERSRGSGGVHTYSLSHSLHR